MGQRRIGRLTFPLALLLLVLVPAFALAYAAVESSAPDFTLKTTRGGTVNLGGLRGSKVVLLWFTDLCQSCQGGLRSLDEIQGEYGSRGLQVLAIVDESTAQKAGSVSAAFSFLVDSDGKVAQEYTGENVRGVCPLNNFYLIDRSGKIRTVKHYPGAAPRMIKAEIESVL